MATTSSREPGPFVVAWTGSIFRIGLAVLTPPLALLRLSRQWRQRASDLRHLAELEDHVLADFGLTRQQVMDEAAKPFWQPLDPGSER
jgi:uncharacterized protein YjiS (DUF1127 family)